MPPLRLAGLLCFLTLSCAGAQDQTQQNPPNVDEPAKVGPGIHAPIPTHTPEAEMPNKAHEKRTGGVCFLSVIVDVKGMPQNPQVTRCTDSIFEENSLKAVKQYRFKPAFRTADGVPVPVTVTIEVNFRFDSMGPTEPPAQIRYGFFSPPGMKSGDPDSDGTYPFSKRLAAPSITHFVSNEFGHAAAVFPDATSCKVVVTLDAKGKPLSATISQCDKPTLERPAIDALMKSKYSPAKLNGQDVPVRVLVYLIYEGFGPHPSLTRTGGQP